MRKLGFSNISSTMLIIQKLKIIDYVFTYHNKALNNEFLEYYFDKIMYVEYVYGKWDSEIYDLEINIDILKSFSSGL